MSKTLVLNQIEKKAFLAKLNKKLIAGAKEANQLFAEQFGDDFDLRAIIDKALDDVVIPIPETDVEVNLIDMMSAMVQGIMKDNAKQFRKLLLDGVGIAIDKGYIKIAEKVED